MSKIIKIIMKIIFIITLSYWVFAMIFKANNYLFVEEVQAIQETLNKQRDVAFQVELTAVSDTVIDTNKKIAKLKVYHDIKILKPFFCRDFDNIEFVE